MHILSENMHIKFSTMAKVSDLLAERFSQDLLETFANNILE